MRTVLVFTLLAAVLPPALSKPTTGNETVAHEQRDNTSVASEYHTFEKAHISKRNTHFGECLQSEYSKKEVEKDVQYCNTGYARHSNNRCYRVVDKPRGGRPVAKHEYEITTGTECYVFDPERNVVELGPQETLDLCDEDGGCDGYVTIEAVVPRRPLNGERN